MSLLQLLCFVTFIVAQTMPAPNLDGVWIGSDTLIGPYNASFSGRALVISAPKFNFTATRSFDIFTNTTPFRATLYDTDCLCMFVVSRFISLS